MENSEDGNYIILTDESGNIKFKDRIIDYLY